MMVLPLASISFPARMRRRSRPSSVRRAREFPHSWMRYCAKPGAGWRQQRAMPALTELWNGEPNVASPFSALLAAARR